MGIQKISLFAITVALSSCSNQVSGFKFLSEPLQPQLDTVQGKGAPIPILEGTTYQSYAAAPAKGPIGYQLVDGSGKVDPSGIYTASCDGACPKNATVRATDVITLNTMDTPYIVYSALSVPPLPAQIQAGDPITAGPATGGYGKITYTIDPLCSINASTGEISACKVPSDNTTVHVIVCDSAPVQNCKPESFVLVPNLSITPKAISIAGGQTFSPTVSGGVGAHACSILSGPGSVDSATCKFTAAGPGSSVIQVIDSGSPKHTDSATVTIVTGLALNVNPMTINLKQTATASGVGGLAPYTYSVVTAGGGAINASSGVFTPAKSGTLSLQVKDALGVVASNPVIVVPDYSISVGASTIAVGGSTNIVHTGGLAPYTCTTAAPGVLTGNSTIGASAPGTITVTCQDKLLSSATATLTAANVFGVSVNPSSIVVGQTSTIKAAGGVGAYHYSLYSGSGNFNAASGVLTATVPGIVYLRGCDSYNPQSCANAAVNVSAALSVTATPPKLAIGATSQVTAVGGIPYAAPAAPYKYEISAGTGTVNVDSGVFKATAIGISKVKATDSQGNAAEVSIETISAFKVDPVAKSLPPSSSFTPTYVGAVGAMNCVISAGGVGSVEASTGKYTAPASVGSATVACTDTTNTTVKTVYTVTAVLAMTPTNVSVSANQTVGFTASGGAPGYLYSMVSGLGSIDSASGIFSALKLWTGDSSSSVVQVKDQSNTVVSANVTLLPSIVQHGAKTANASFENGGGVSLLDDENNLTVVGTTTADNFGDQLGVHGNEDCAISKVSTAGNLIWTKQIGGGAGTYLHCASASIVADSAGNVYFVGETDSNSVGDIATGIAGNEKHGFIGKIDRSGKLVWIKLVNSGSRVSINNRRGLALREIAISKSGELFASGTSESSANFDDIGAVAYGATPSAITPIVVKFDADGNFLRGAQVTYGGNGTSEVTSAILLDSIGNVVVVAYSTGCQDTITAVACSHDWEGRIAKFDAGLTQRAWVHGLGGMNGGSAGITFDANDNIYVAGQSTNKDIGANYGTIGTTNATVLKISPTGSLIASALYGAGDGSNAGVEAQWTMRLKLLSSGEMLLGGSVTNGKYGTVYGVNGASDAYLMRLDSGLAPIVQSQIGVATARLTVQSLQVNSKGEIFLTGVSDVSNPTVQLSAHQKSDFMTVKFSAKGVAQQ